MIVIIPVVWLWCELTWSESGFLVLYHTIRGLVLSVLGPSWGIGWGGPSGEDSISQSGSPPMLSSPQIVLVLLLVLSSTAFC